VNAAEARNRLLQFQDNFMAKSWQAPPHQPPDFAAKRFLRVGIFYGEAVLPNKKPATGNSRGGFGLT